MKRTVFATPYLVWMVLFIVVPMLFIGYAAFFEKDASGTLHFTTELISKALTDTTNLRVLGRSVVLALETTLICLLIGYPVAYILSKMKKSTAAILSMFFILPMWMNFLLRTYAWQVILNDNGIVNMLLGALGFADADMLYTRGAVLLGMVYNFLPFMILPIYTVLTKLDRSHIEAAHDLGANSVQTFIKIVLPLSIPGIVSGITMVFIPSITSFAVSRLLGGRNMSLFGDLIEETVVTFGEMGLGAALSIILFVLVIISMFIMRRVEAASGEPQEGGMIW